MRKHHRGTTRPRCARRGTAGPGTTTQGFSNHNEEETMKTAVATLKSISPYSQSRHHVTPKLDKESAADYEARTWRQRLHATDDGFVFIPPMSFKNCLSEVAKYLSVQIPGKGKSTYTKHIEAGILVTDPLVLPNRASDVAPEWLFVPADGRRGSGKRVDRCFGVIPQWGGEVTFYVMDETVTKDVLLHHLKQAGQFIGIGRFRPRNNGYYGRFVVESLQWS
jgi:hypothetical protein